MNKLTLNEFRKLTKKTARTDITDKDIEEAIEKTREIKEEENKK
jgi:hypothetical protein